MLVRVIVIGKTQKGFIGEGEQEYLKRLSRYIKLERIVIPEVKNASSKTAEQVKQEEGIALISRLGDNESYILLDEKGIQRSSENFADWLQYKFNQGGKRITFVIGGAYGFSDEVYQKAQAKMALSEMTFSHQMVRMVFLEQLYRAFTILKGEPYHHK